MRLHESLFSFIEIWSIQDSSNILVHKNRLKKDVHKRTDTQTYLNSINLLQTHTHTGGQSNTIFVRRHTYVQSLFLDTQKIHLEFQSLLKTRCQRSKEINYSKRMTFKHPLVNLYSLKRISETGLAVKMVRTERSLYLSVWLCPKMGSIQTILLWIT